MSNCSTCTHRQQCEALEDIFLYSDADHEQKLAAMHEWFAIKREVNNRRSLLDRLWSPVERILEWLFGV